MQNNKIFLLFPDGVGIRNYLYSDVFKNAKEDLFLFHNFDKETITALKDTVSLSESIEIPLYKESIKEKFLRELICLIRLYYNAEKLHNPSLLANWNWSQKTLSNKLFYKVAEIIAPFIKKYDTILKLEKSYQKAIRENLFYKEVKAILKQVQPNTVFCSHQRALKAATIFAAARDLGISTTAAIYSWDNLPKARLAMRADSYLVWSNYMKKEMELLYPEIPADSIYITGTPQFEFYEDKQNIMDRELFFKKYNLDSEKKIICFSGDDSKTSPDDPSYLRDIASELTKSNLTKNFQILLRRCPVDFSGRFDEVVKEFPDLIREVPPLWYYNTSKEWNAVYPSMEDVKLLVSTAFYSDLVINVGSTMAFDFAMFQKPCIYINYDQENKLNPKWSVQTIYQFQHFRSMPNKECVIWWNNRGDFQLILNELDNSFNKSTIKQWSDVVLDKTDSCASEKIKKHLSLC